jgi:hypothetical protein
VSCYVEAKTGAITIARSIGDVAYTHTWEILVPGPDGKSQSLLKYGD